MASRAPGAHRDRAGALRQRRFPSVDGFVTNRGMPGLQTVMDFVRCAYYVEATLTASAIVVGHPAEIAVVRVNFTL